MSALGRYPGIIIIIIIIISTLGLVLVLKASIIVTPSRLQRCEGTLHLVTILER